MNEIRPLGSVALLKNRPDASLQRGDVGTVVEVFAANENHPGGCIVEFLDEFGNVQVLLNVTDLNDLMPLNLNLQAA